ncbi:tail fiber protein [Bradyrhizobium sp. OK095]|uniref:tail fiber protein n=1 Tax=Bradyrhizobium sp. OK095 TaxID=1882760 RepID=UPI0008D3AA09|nr:tail fiber protein [Bradyrhizobium sp. OK095]SEN66611.1 Microcystin-dependent protein [Bradyrhizobium sp. OK095]
MTLYKWSQTASADATADSTINWAEGQSPASVNDSGRAMMAAISKYRDDIAGAIVTSGTLTAYTVASFQQFDTLAHLDGKEIAFTPHATNGATVTLSVDGLGNKPLRSAPGTELPAGILVQGTPYVAVYNNGDGAFYLRGFFGSPYLIPLGGMIDFIGATAPNSLFALPFGQAISRTTYATLFAMVGTTYGAGDGTTTFNVPDLRGRVVAGKDDMGGSAASRLTAANFGSNPQVLGSAGGAEGFNLAANQIPSLTSVNASQAISVTSSQTNVPSGPNINNALQTPNNGPYSVIGTVSGLATLSQITSTGNNSISVTYTNASQQVTKSVQPTIIANKILRII